MLVGISACTFPITAEYEVSDIQHDSATASTVSPEENEQQPSPPSPAQFDPSDLTEANIALNEKYLANLIPLRPNNIEITNVVISESSEDDICRLEIEYPQIHGLANATVEDEINTYLKDSFLNPAIYEDIDFVRPLDVDTCAENLKNNLVQCLHEAENPRHCPEQTYAVLGGYDISLNSGNLLSIRDDGYISGISPALHPTKHRIWINIDLITGQEFLCDDFFKSDQASKTRLAELTHQSPEYPCIPTTITESGIAIAPYSHHAGFWGTYQIPYVFLRDIISPDGPLHIFLPPRQE